MIECNVFIFFLMLFFSITCTVGIERDGDENSIVTSSSLDQLFHASLDAMNDYTTDSRGDVGAW